MSTTLPTPPNGTGPRLDGEVVKRPLHFFWLVDCSGSMEGAKINSLNRAIADAIPAVKKALQGFPQAPIMMRAIKFSSDADWHIGPTPVSLDTFIWSDLYAGGATATASAINMLSDELDIEKMTRKAYPPVCILLSDGYCTESDEDYNDAISRLDKLPWGKKAVRLVIAIGNENDYDEEALLKFTNHKEVGLLKAHNSAQLVEYIQWAAVSASVSSSRSRSNNDINITSDNGEGQNVILNPPPAGITVMDSADVF